MQREKKKKKGKKEGEIRIRLVLDDSSIGGVASIKVLEKGGWEKNPKGEVRSGTRKLRRSG